MFAWSLLRHQHFGSSALDLGAYESVFWSLGQRGSLNNSIERMHQWSAHFEVGLLPLWLPYRFFPSVAWLFALQAACCASAGLFLERLARRALGDSRAALVCAVTMLLTPQFLLAQVDDFHSITLCALPISILLCGIDEDRPVLLWTGAWGALLLREQMGLAVIGAALAWIVVHGGKRFFQAALLSGVGLGVFLAEVHWLIPHFASQGPFRYLAHYQRVGGSLGAAARLALSHPLRFGLLLFEGERPIYIWELAHFGLPLIALGFVAPRKLAWPLLLATPLLVVQLLAGKKEVWSIHFQYGAPVVPALTAAVVLAIAWLYRRSRTQGKLALAGWLFGTVGMLLPNALTPLTHAGGPLDLAFGRSPRAAALSNLLALIPPTASVSAQDGIAPHLADRAVIHQWPDGESEDRFVALDVDGLSNNVKNESPAQAAARLRNDPNFRISVDEAGVLLAERIERN